MDGLHAVGVTVETPEMLEGVSPHFLHEGLLDARRRTWEVVAELRSCIREGLSEDDARKLAYDVFRDFGVTKHWHRPYVRFGPGTTRTFHEPLQPDYRLRADDAFFVDVGPVWAGEVSGLEYEGDAGDTFCLGENADVRRCAAIARELFDEAQAAWRTQQLSGRALYALMQRGAEARSLKLLPSVDGHRLSDFPHQRYAKARLSGLDFTPSNHLWVLEAQVVDEQKQLGAFFEDLLSSATGQ